MKSFIKAINKHYEQTAEVAPDPEDLDGVEWQAEMKDTKKEMMNDTMGL